MVESVLYATQATDRFSILPVGHQPAAGDLEIVSTTGEDRCVDPVAVAPYEVTPEEAQAHLRAEAERALAGVDDMLAQVLGIAGEEPSDLRRVAERLGLTGGDRQATEAAVRGLAVDVKAIVAAVASGQPGELATARGRLAARGIDLGDALDNLARRLEEIRRLDQHDVLNAAVGGLHAFIDAIEGDSDQSLGRRIDALIARLEREVGPYVGRDRVRNHERRQAEYRRDARSAIADSLRSAGITPLNDPGDDEREP